MCGICGFTGPADEAVLQRMTAAIFHRGPDEDGYYLDGRVNLGMRRLSIIDLQTGRQPIHNEDRTIWLVFNGEIYNYIELREELERKGHRFYTSHSDSEVIVHLYEEYGDDFVHKLNGMFAIAIWDRAKEDLILVRDRMGVKPLFYALVKGRLIFGSEIKTILLHPAYEKTPNFEAIYHYFSLKNIPSPLTAFQDIHSMRPAEIIHFKNGRFDQKVYWRMPFAERDEYTENLVSREILAILEDAVRIRMRSDVPFGAYLSGGVDSSTIVALMTRFSSRPVKTFTLGYEDELQNKEADLYWARKVSQMFGTEHYEYIMSARELIEDIDRIIRSFDQPFSGTISTFFLTKLISRHVKVAISGDAADELFGSYLSHRTAGPIHHFARLYGKFKAGGLTSEELALLAPCDPAFLEDLYLKSQGDEARWRYQLCVFLDEEKDTLLTDHFKSRLNGVSSFNLLKENFKDLKARDPLNRILEMEWTTQFVDQVLAFMDFLSMAHAVEIRSPFLDYRLVEFVAAIPGRMKIRNGNVKDILKRTVADLIPRPITQRPKEGFVLPIFDWMVAGLTGYCDDVLSQARLKKHGLLNTDRVGALVRAYQAGDRKLAAKIWNLMMFQVWWENYFG